MREIKFRIWDDRNKVMTTEDNYDELDYNDLANEWEDIFYTFPYEQDEWYPMSSIQLFFELPEDEDLKVMQYSGLNDESGTDVYEKDILKCGNDVYLVIYRQAAFILKRLDNKDQSLMLRFAIDKMSVVGNAYENPEIIEQYHVEENELPF